MGPKTVPRLRLHSSAVNEVMVLVSPCIPVTGFIYRPELYGHEEVFFRAIRDLVSSNMWSYYNLYLLLPAVVPLAGATTQPVATCSKYHSYVHELSTQRAATTFCNSYLHVSATATKSVNLKNAVTILTRRIKNPHKHYYTVEGHGENNRDGECQDYDNDDHRDRG